MASGEKNKSLKNLRPRPTATEDLIKSDDNLKIDIENVLKEVLCDARLLDEVAKALAPIIAKQYEAKMEIALNKISQLETKLNEKDAQITVLTSNIQDLEQYSRRNSVRIFGVPEEEGENTNKLVSDLCNNIGVQVVDSDIDRSHRVGKRVGNKPRAIIVKFNKYCTKSSVCKSRKKLKGTRIFIKEDLTKFNLHLLNLAAEKLGFKNVWSYDGKIFYKNTSGITRIKNVTDLTRL